MLRSPRTAPALLPLLLLCAAPVGADVSLTLPLDGYYRPGRYMPVRFAVSVRTTAPDACFTILARNSVHTRVTLSDAPAHGAAPFLTFDGSLPNLRVHMTNGSWAGDADRIDLPALRALGADQRLIAFTTADPAAANALFPGQSVIPVNIDLALLLSSPSIAWETLDALLLDSAAASQLNDDKIAELLALNITLAVRTQDGPRSPWPWRQHGALWILRPNLSGPTIAGAYPAAFAPVQGWQADWPASFRRRIFLYGVIFAILALATCLMRWRAATILTVLLSSAVVFALALWWRSRGAVLERTGSIGIVHPDLIQLDSWTYHASATPTPADIRWFDAMRPFFEQPADAQVLGLLLHCDSTGRPLSFQYQLPPGLKVAFLSRSVDPPAQPPSNLPSAERNPLLLLARRAYPGQIIGQIKSDAPAIPNVQRWPTLLIDRRPLRTLTPPATTSSVK